MKGLYSKYMRKNKFGKIPRFDKRVVKALRDEGNLSFQEIADKLKMGSRQVARYYYLRAVDKKRLTSICEKGKIKI